MGQGNSLGAHIMPLSSKLQQLPVVRAFPLLALLLVGLPLLLQERQVPAAVVVPPGVKRPVALVLVERGRAQLLLEPGLHGPKLLPADRPAGRAIWGFSLTFGRMAALFPADGTIARCR
jgi:hypothetical protein